MTSLLAIGIKIYKSRLEGLSMVMLGIIEARTVNLKAVANVVQSWAQEDSIYRCFQRFFAEFMVDGLLDGQAVE